MVKIIDFKERKEIKIEKKSVICFFEDHIWYKNYRVPDWLLIQKEIWSDCLEVVDTTERSWCVCDGRKNYWLPKSQLFAVEKDDDDYEKNMPY